jgi:prepilin-type N-terminal cleavage/methylation domain-containing protein
MAFTLLEIMIVVAIVGLLLAIAVPSFVKSRQRAQRELCIENLHQIETAKQLLALEHGSRPDEELFLDDIAGPGLYLKVEPECPAGGEYHVNTVRIPAECTIEGHELGWND